MIKKRIKMIFYFLMIYIIKGDTINLNLKIDNISFWKENKIFVEKCTKNMIKENICAYLEEDVIKIGDKYLQQFESEEYDTYIIELNLEGKILKIPYIKRKKGMSVENLIGFTRMKKCNKEKNWNCQTLPNGYFNGRCKEGCNFISLDEENRLYIEWY